MSKDTGEDTPKTETGEDTPKTESKTPEQLAAELEKKEELAKNQAWRAAKAEESLKEMRERLAGYEAAEQEKLEKEKIASWEFEELKKQLLEKEEALSNETITLKTENEKLSTEYSELLSGLYDEKIAVIPEDKQDFAKQMVDWFEGKARIEKLDLVIKTLGINSSFGGGAKVEATAQKKLDRKQTLIAKQEAFHEDPSKNPQLTFTERQELSQILEK